MLKQVGCLTSSAFYLLVSCSFPVELAHLVYLMSLLPVSVLGYES